MAKTKKVVKSNKVGASTSPIKKKSVAVKKNAARTVIKKKAAKAVVKKKVAKKPVVKKKALRTVVKKKAAKSAMIKKAASKGTQAASKAKILKATIAALKDELKILKNELKSAAKRESAISSLTSQRDVAVGNFLGKWDKKAKAALEKSLKPKKKKRSRK